MALEPSAEVDSDPSDAEDDAAPPACDPIAAARAILARFPIRAPEDIAIELMAAECGAYVVVRRSATADARVVRDGREAFIAIAPEALDTPRGRFSMAHEFSHHVMHGAYAGAIRRIHGAPQRGREFRVEREANVCASELILPTFLFAPMCVAAEPTLDEVSRVAALFRASLSATARRWPGLSNAACAFV
ncbi:MAG TPA: ImmA/IrrE family metallo-endopeptidase, partial [Polyangiaceae bacterium]